MLVFAFVLTCSIAAFVAGVRACLMGRLAFGVPVALAGILFLLAAEAMLR